MNVVHALQPLTKSIFLAGPTPRDPEVPSWRPEALRILREEYMFNGTVYVPEAEDWTAHDNYDAQIHWEWEAINQATVVAFWVPRELTTMPAFTTNVEFGMLVNSGKVIIGYPHGTPKMGYLDALARRFNIQPQLTLEGTMWAASRLAHEITWKAQRKP